MKRRFLEDLGLTKEQIDSIMSENGKDINAAKSDYDALKEELLSNQSYMTTNAGKNKSIIVIPSAHLLTCSQHFVLGVEDMAKAAYPELFS